MTRRERRTLLRVCKNRGHAWHPVHPYSMVLSMGRWRCYRCHRHCWLTREQVLAGHRQHHIATSDPEWTQEKIRKAVFGLRDDPTRDHPTAGRLLPLP